MSNPNFPKISIITPSFNQGQYIEETILSVIEQNYPNLEYIIIDGGSTDNTVDIIKKYEKHIDFWVSEKDKGQSDAINKGIRKITGDVVNWLNSDDYYMPGALHHVANVFSDKSVTAYCGKSRIFSDTSEKISQGTDVYANNLAKTIGWARIDQPETFFKKEVWDKIGELNESFHYVMDKEWWMRYLFQYGLSGIVKDDKVLVNFRIHNDSKTGSQLEKFKEETINLFNSLAATVDDKRFYKLQGASLTVKKLQGYNITDKNLLRQSINYFLFLLMAESYAQNQYDQAHEISRLVDKPSLSQEDKNELEKIMFRMRIFPPAIKRLINKYF